MKKLVYFLIVVGTVISWWRLSRRYKVSKAFADAKLPAYTPPQVFHHNHVMTLGRAVDPKAVLPSYLKYKEAL